MKVRGVKIMSRKKRFLLVLLILISVYRIYHIIDKINYNRYVSKSNDIVDMWEKDIDYLAYNLPKKHKDLFYKVSKDDFTNQIENLKKQIRNMNDDEIKMNIQKIIASIGDGHTSVNVSLPKVFPLQLYYFKDGIYVINTLDEHEEIMYSKLKEINGISIDNIIEDVSQIISHDNEFGLKNDLPLHLILSEVLHGLGIIDNPDVAKFVFENQNKESIEVELESISGEEYFDNIFSKERKDAPLYMRNNDQYYWFEYLENEKTVYFKYSQCINMKDKPFKEFSKELIDFINSNDVEKLVIDIRNNGGGNSAILDGFINEISKNKLNKEDNLFVIIGRRTFSSAILNSISLKEKTKATFVGEPTGGKPNHFGEVKSFKLPNSQIVINYSSKYFKHYKEDIPFLSPDKVIELTIDDYIRNNDPVLEYILSI